MSCYINMKPLEDRVGCKQFIPSGAFDPKGREYCALCGKPKGKELDWSKEQSKHKKEV